MPGVRLPGRLVRTFLFLALLVTGEGMSAAQDLGPGRYRVTGVDSSDTLNVRAEPTTGSAVVGQLPSDATGISALGGQVEVGASTWLEIAYRDLRGWVNARYLMAQPIRTGELPMPLRCSGTEPFWSLSVDDGALLFDLLDDQRSFAVSGPVRSANSTLIWSFPIENGETGSGALFVKETGDCSDGMSEQLYHFEVMLNLPGAGGVFSGCCN